MLDVNDVKCIEQNQGSGYVLHKLQYPVVVIGGRMAQKARWTDLIKSFLPDLSIICSNCGKAIRFKVVHQSINVRTWVDQSNVSRDQLLPFFLFFIDTSKHFKIAFLNV